MNKHIINLLRETQIEYLVASDIFNQNIFSQLKNNNYNASSHVLQQNQFDKIVTLVHYEDCDIFFSVFVIYLLPHK